MFSKQTQEEDWKRRCYDYGRKIPYTVSWHNKEYQKSW